MTGSVVALFAHPDDEAYSAAGILAACADAGSHVLVVCATDCGAERTAELHASCGIIGAEALVLGFPDGALAQHIDDARARLAPLLKPSATLVTHGLDGAYGHRDHIACAHICAGAAVKRLLHVCFPEGHFAPMRRRLFRAMPHIIDDEAPPYRAASHRVQLGPLGERKRRAIAAHRSQARIFTPSLVAPLLLSERFYAVA